MHESAPESPAWSSSNTLGDLLTLWGRRLGWTQRDWALHSGLAERTVREYLNDRKESLDLNSVAKLVRAVEAAAGVNILNAALELAEAHAATVSDRRRRQERLRLRELDARAELARRIGTGHDAPA